MSGDTLRLLFWVGYFVAFSGNLSASVFTALCFAWHYSAFGNITLYVYHPVQIYFSSYTFPFFFYFLFLLTILRIEPKDALLLRYTQSFTSLFIIIIIIF